MELTRKLASAHDKGPMGSRRIHDLMIGADDRTVRPILPCQPLDDLIRSLTPF